MKLTITTICFLTLLAYSVTSCNEQPAGNNNSSKTETAATEAAGNDTGADDAGTNDARTNDAAGNERRSNDTATSLAGINMDEKNRMCYASYKNRDTASFSFIQNDTAIRGELVYNFYQKDRNKGTVTGYIKGDTIIADYRFSSEGTTSTRQVVFLRRGTRLVEGFGDVLEDNGKMVFSNRAALSFDSSMVLQLIDCKRLAPAR